MPLPPSASRRFLRRSRLPLGGRDVVAALRDLEARYEGLFQNVPDALFWIGVSPEGAFVVESVNPAQERTVGLAAQGRLGRPLTEWLPPEVAEQVQANYRRCLEAGAPISYEEVADLGAGPRTFQTTLVPIRDRAGRFHRLVGISRDVTEQRRSQESAILQELLFRRMFEHSGDPGLLIEGNQFVDCNQATVDILGAQDKAQVLGTHPSELSPEFQPDGRASKEKADDMIARAFRQGFHRFEWVHRRLDGGLFPVEVLLTVVPYQGKQFLHTTWRDRTEAQRAEAQRQHLEAQIRQAQKMESLGVLAGGIAHDFNNLLTAILGNLNLAHAHLAAGDPAVAFLETAEGAVMKAADLTRQMLAYSGQGRFVVQLQDVNSVVRDMAHLLHVSVSKMAELRLDLAEGLPPIEADGAQFQQVVMNLVTNASEALGEAPGLIELRTGQARLSAEDIHQRFPTQDLAPGSFVTLQVRDSGQGMGPEVQARIFDPFFTTKATGRGLGLSAMLGILRGHHAGLALASAPGQGTTFTLYFPAAEGAFAQPAKAAPGNSGTFTGRVLLVDDEPALLTTLETSLTALGLTVTTARDGAEAVALLAQQPSDFDLVLMDLTMPRMNGRDAFRAMRALRPDLPVILSSGYSEQASIQSLMGEGLAGFLAKPYPLEVLRGELARVLPPS